MYQRLEENEIDEVLRRSDKVKQPKVIVDRPRALKAGKEVRYPERHFYTLFY